SGRLCGEPSVFGDQWRRPACRRGCHPHDGVGSTDEKLRSSDVDRLTETAVPVNAPRCPVHHYHKDGPMRFFDNNTKNPDAYYEPNPFNGPKEDQRCAG